MSKKRTGRIIRKKRARRGRRSTVKVRLGKRPRKTLHVPRTAREFFAMPEKLRDQWTSVTQAITRIRDGRLSVRDASREFDLNPGVLTRLGKSALRRRKNGKYVAKSSDTLLRILAVPAPQGTREVAIRSSKQASILGEYWNAVQRYLQTGETSGLERFKRKRKRIVSADGKLIRLITDPDQLTKLGSAGVLSFESLYGSDSR